MLTSFKTGKAERDIEGVPLTHFVEIADFVNKKKKEPWKDLANSFLKEQIEKYTTDEERLKNLAENIIKLSYYSDKK